jgi:pectate lyase
MKVLAMKKSMLSMSCNPRPAGVLTAGLLLVFRCLLPAQQSLPWYEPFDYPPERLGVSGAASSSVWTLGSTGSSADCVQVSDSAALSYSGLDFNAASRGALIATTTTTRNKGVLFTTVSSGRLYNSFLLNVKSLPSGNRVFACLSTSTGGSTSMGNPSASVWLDSSGRLLISKASTTTPAATHPSALATNTTYLIVTRYDFTVTPHQFALWLNPPTNTFGGPDPGNPDIATTASSDQASLSSWWFHHISSTPQMVAAVDEIRVGTSWADVTPPRVSAPTKLGFVTQPTTTPVNTPLNPIVVQVQDAYGAAVATSNVPVTVSLYISGSTGVLSGTTTKLTDANGQATFTDLTLNRPAVVNLLSASAPGLTTGISGLFEVVPGGTPKSPRITEVLATPTAVILRGTNGDAGAPFQLLASTNLSVPRSNWTVLGTFNFDGSGNFNFTNPISPGAPQRFFCIRPLGGGAGGGSEPPSGYATAGPGITGGAGGPVYIITNIVGFIAAASNNPAPATLLILSNLTLSSAGSFYLGPNKTLIGVGTNVTITGDLAIYGTQEVSQPATNIIIRNLVFTNPNGWGEGDGITLKYGGRNVWVDHCTFVDCSDGMVDATRESDFLTVSWCRFYYTVPNFASHPDVNLIGGSDSDTTDLGKLHVTFHHNWWGAYCRERMPSVRFGRAHVYNNYYNSTNNNYCVRTRLYAEVLVENNFFEFVQNPWERLVTTGTPGKLRASGNITNNCTWNTNYNTGVSGAIVEIPDGSETLTAGDPLGLNPPPYAYTLQSAADAKQAVIEGAGAGRGPFAP